MAKSKSAATARPQSRWVLLLGGIILGFLWGTLMWGFAALIGQKTGGVKGWLYIAISMGMIGGGVSAIFGAFGAVRRGERVGPRFRRAPKDPQ